MHFEYRKSGEKSSIESHTMYIIEFITGDLMASNTAKGTVLTEGITSTFTSCTHRGLIVGNGAS